MQSDQSLYHRVEAASGGYTLSLENLLQGGLDHFRRAPGGYILYSLLSLLCFSNPVSGLLFGGPLLAGYYMMCKHAEGAKHPDSAFFFGGMRFFLPLLVLNLLISLLLTAGLVLLVFPSIYLAISFLFAHFFIIFYHCSPREALKMSWKTVSGNFRGIFMLFLALAGINLLGFLLLGFGLLISMPLSACTLYTTFDDIIGIPKT